MSATRVTVLNDDPDILDMFRMLFEEKGYVVETYEDALPGIEKLIASSPDLIVVDIRLDPHREQLGGLQVIHSARSSAELRDVPVIVVAADPQMLADAWPDLMARGDIHQLAKPFDLPTFDRVVEAALGIAHTGEGRADAGRIVSEGNQSQATERDQSEG